MSRYHKLSVYWLKHARAAAVLFTALLVGAGGALSEPITIRFSHVVGEDTPKGVGARLFKERAEKELAGRVKVEIYPNSQRFTDEQVMTALLFGDVELAAPSLSKFGSFSKELQVFDLPFLFDDMEAVRRFQTSPVGQSLLDSMSMRGIKGLAYWDNGMRVMSANKALLKPADVQKLVFRIEPSDVIEAQYATLRAPILRLPFKQVYEALDRGLVEGQENSWSNIASKRFYAAQDYFTETNHSYQGYMVITSVRFWDSLPPQIRSTLEEILADVSKTVRQLAVEKAREGRESVQTSSSHVLSLTAEQRAAWREALRPVWERFESQIGADVIEAAVAAGEKDTSAP